ncbi:hypothetical protein H4Q26_010977 [Puccinia striiformis f. sp. tritici PST-130]|nr:hypothetical protein H4Q26_010977 [Puccinia striiformis f. sp. tritici PST-130]
MLISLSFITLGFSINACFSKSPSPRHKSRDTNIRALFEVAPGTQLTYPPTDTAGPEPRPEWIAAYQTAKQAGLIPSVPPSVDVDGSAVYPTCAPPGIAGISFDDGPQPPSLPLLNFLKDKSQIATHFLIGSRIINNPDIFRELDEAGQHLAVHTYSHPMTTTLTDLQIVGELGWTMQLIHDRSKKHVVPAHWRPPYGDTDQRVQAIAKNVFGLKTILWMYDPRDLQKSLNVFVHSPKRLGLIILNHEQSTRAVAGFKYAFPLMKKCKWITLSIPDAFRIPWYQ